MTSKIVTRCLGVVGVAGGLVLLSAAASNAADNPLGNLTDGVLGGSSQSATGTDGSAAGAAGVSAPITLGGASLGLSTESSQSSGSTTTTTDADGSSVTRSQEQSSSDATNLGVDVGSITVDPAAWAAGVAGDDSAQGAAAVQAPVQVEGLAVTGSSTSQARSAEQVTSSAADGDSWTEGSRTESASSTQGGIAVGEVALDPTAAVAGSADDDTATGTVEAASPVTLGGVAAGFDDARAERSTSWGSTREDGVTRTWQEQRADASRTGGELGLGRVTVDPMVSGTTATDGRDDRATGSLDLAAPLHADGAWAQGWSERVSSGASDRSVSGPQGMQRSTSWWERADAVRPSFATGPVDADPTGWAWSTVASRD